MDSKNTTIRVMHIIPNLKRGGAERLVVTILNELQKNEVFSCLLVLLYPENEYTELTSNIKMVVCNSKIKLSILRKHSAVLKEFEAIVKDFNPHVIHSHLFESEVLSRFAIKQNIAYVSHIHNNEKQLKNFSVDTVLKKELFTNYYEKQFIIKQYKKCNNYFIAISKHTDLYLKNVLPISFHNRIIYLPNAIDFDAFYSDKMLNFIARFVSVGRLDENKNQSFLIDVIKSLNQKKINCVLDIFGEGVTRDLLGKKIIDSSIENLVFLKGNVKNVQKLYVNYSLYLHSAKSESFGLVLLEAMASGLPVVALNAGGNREVVLDGVNGFLIEDHNPSLFADKIIQIMNDKELYFKMSENAIKHAKKHDIKEYIKKLTTFYKSIILENQ